MKEALMGGTDFRMTPRDQNVITATPSSRRQVIQHWHAQERARGSESEPQLLAAVASVRPLTALQSRGAKAAGQVFPAALAEAQQSGQQIFATARYFRLER
jgi:hypothetical protein